MASEQQYKKCICFHDNTTKTTGLRPMTAQDVLVVQALLREHLKAFHLSPVMTLEDVEHWLLPQDGVIDTYVVESMTGTVTDMVSFYTLPSTALNHPVHKGLKAACVLYCISKATPLLQLMGDTLIICKARGFDVFSAMDVMDNKAFLEPLKFRMGEVHKQYYLFNCWSSPHTFVRLYDLDFSSTPGAQVLSSECASHGRTFALIATWVLALPQRFDAA
ncbi:glycylpeptide N-tetradecanoyltransferase 1-like [Rhinichthys klamathensis goyatoka]|uniref:glycylpeptide N-tetradecanoyltransferase 1-like n=1 Tax=Rhinichthys klamathensis goyatoka TaxID=3034132 RepID=UPI0024B4ABD4|nr:glycylpeptide N-tetradecanoyltransferase 1-like [Rhinichthys klamathensis goyatoka]